MLNKHLMYICRGYLNLRLVYDSWRGCLNSSPICRGRPLILRLFYNLWRGCHSTLILRFVVVDVSILRFVVVDVSSIRFVVVNVSTLRFVVVEVSILRFVVVEFSQQTLHFTTHQGVVRLLNSCCVIWLFDFNVRCVCARCITSPIISIAQWTKFTGGSKTTLLGSG